MSEAKRYCLVVDNSSHWYIIPLALRGLFDELNERLEDEDDEDAWRKWNEQSFDAMRLAMHASNYSFTDWQEDVR